MKKDKTRALFKTIFMRIQLNRSKYKPQRAIWIACRASTKDRDLLTQILRQYEGIYRNQSKVISNLQQTMLKLYKRHKNTLKLKTENIKNKHSQIK